MRTELTLLELAARGDFSPVRLTYAKMEAGYFCARCAREAYARDPNGYAAYDAPAAPYPVTCRSCWRDLPLGRVEVYRE